MLLDSHQGTGCKAVAKPKKNGQAKCKHVKLALWEHAPTGYLRLSLKIILAKISMKIVN